MGLIDKVIAKIKIPLGIKKQSEVISKEDINILNTKIGTKRNVTYKIELNQVKAPIKKGDIVGSINVIENNNIIMTRDATIKEDVNKANIITVYLRNILDIIKGNISLNI